MQLNKKIHFFNTKLILVFFISIFFAMPSQAAVENDHTIAAIKTISESIKLSDQKLSDKTIARLYYLARLNRMTTLLQKFGRYRKKVERNIASKIVLNFIEEPEKSLFSHPQIKKCMNDIKNDHSFSPLIEIWNDLKHYKHIEDILLVEEYAKLGMFIIKQIILESLKINRSPASTTLINNLQKLYNQGISLPIYKLSEFIDYFTDLYEKTEKNNFASLSQYPIADIQNFNKIMQERFHPEIQANLAPNLIIKRFYHIQRISKAFEKLATIKNRTLSKIILRPKNSKKWTLIDDNLDLNNSLITECASHIENSKQLGSLFRLWDNVQNYKLIEDDEFIKEFVVIVIALCKNIMLNLTNNHDTTTISLEDALEMYDQIADFPIIKLLDVLDIFAENLSDLMEKYDIEGGIIPKWREWLFQQWWIPPLIVIGITISLLQQQK